MTNTITQTAVATAETLLPTILAAVSPQAASIAALAPIAIQLLQAAAQLENAGAMTSDQLASLFLTIGQGVQSTHNQWAALNAAASTAV